MIILSEVAADADFLTLVHDSFVFGMREQPGTTMQLVIGVAINWHTTLFTAPSMFMA